MQNVLALACVVFLGLAACGSDSSDGSGAAGSGGSGSEPLNSMMEFARKEVEALCARTARCCQTAGRKYDVESCETSLLPDAYKVADKATFHPELGQACLDALQNSPCEDEDAADKACGPVFRGPAKAGEPCEVSSQCEIPAGALSASCEGNTSGAHVCVAVLPPEEGQSCTFLDQTSYHDCDGAKDFRCDSGQVCRKRAAAGEACKQFLDCAEGTYCEADKCAPQKGLDEPCDPKKLDCSSGLYCNEQGKCAATKKTGEACTLTGCDGVCDAVAGRCVEKFAVVCSD